MFVFYRVCQKHEMYQSFYYLNRYYLIFGFCDQNKRVLLKFSSPISYNFCNIYYFNASLSARRRIDVIFIMVNVFKQHCWHYLHELVVFIIKNPLKRILWLCGDCLCQNIIAENIGISLSRVLRTKKKIITILPKSRFTKNLTKTIMANEKNFVGGN